MKELHWGRVGLAAGLFLSITYTLCVGFDLFFPSMAMHVVWQGLLPGFTWLTPGSFILGLLESFFYGIYFAIVFVPIYNSLGKGFAEKPVV